MQSFRKILKKLSIVAVVFFLCAILLAFYANRLIEKTAKGFVYTDVSEVPARKVGLLLGTSVKLPDGRKNLFMVYRLDAAESLFKNKKIEYVLVSGDNGTQDYNEPEAIRAALVARGIPENRIVLDYAGFRTLDSIIRAKEVFGQSEFTVISQEFHNERALFIAHGNDIPAIAFNAKEVSSSVAPRVYLREYFARAAALVDVYVLSRNPKFYGEPIAIGPSETGAQDVPRTESLTGVYVCLPHRDTTGPQTMECAFGLKANDGKYYALSFNKVPELANAPMNVPVTIAGELVPIEKISSDHWRIYPIEGIMEVESLTAR